MENNNQPLLRYLAVGRLAKECGQFIEGSHEVVASFLADPNDTAAKNYKTHVKEIMDKGAKKLTIKKRIRLTSDDEDYNLHVMADTLENDMEKLIVYFVVTSTGFSTPPISHVLEEFRTNFLLVNDVQSIQKAKAKGQVHKQSQTLLKNLATKHKSTKLQDVQLRVDEVKNVMKDNVNQALVLVDSMQMLDDKSSRLQQNSSQFQKGTTQMKKQMRWRNMKIYLICFILIAAVLAYIIAEVVDTDDSKD